MAPRKKSNPSTTSSSSSKKSNPKDQHSQPPKYGIQHFFERHTQNALSNNSQNPPNSRQPPPSLLPTTTAANQNPKTSRTPDPISNPTNSRTTRQTTANSRISNSSNSGTFDQNNAVSAVENPTKEQLSSGKVDTNDWKSASILGTRIDTSNPTEITPPENILPIVIDSDDNEPSEVPAGPSKSKPLQRLKFSPGMLIKQSQDDGGDEVTWKISPVNERLQMISKHNPETIRVLADASRLNSLSFRQCSQNKKSPGPAGKLEKWISSPILKTAERSLLIANKVGFKRLKPDLYMDFNGNAINTNNVGEVSQQSPFRTPPSLSYCHVKFGNDIACNGASHQPEIRQHKKALIELLDQVEDVISVEDALSGDMEACLADSKDRNGGDMDVKVNPAVKGAATILPEMVNRAAFKPLFLVLEVSEKRKHTESQCPFKVLRLLDEQSGREQVVHLWDEW